MLGIGIGGTAEKAVLLAKEALMEDIDMYELQAKSARGDKLSQLEVMRLELFEKVNALGIGAQGLGGLTTVLDIKIKMFPCHAAGKPVAMIPNCAATRHAHFELDGSGPAYIDPPSLDLWPKVDWAPDTQKSKRVDLNRLTKEEIATWKAGQTLLLNGKMLTGRTRPTSASRTCWPRASRCRWTSPTASSTTWVRSTRCATRWSVPRVRRLPRAWTSSPT
jgi:fumarate hydratase class I